MPDDEKEFIEDEEIAEQDESAEAFESYEPKAKPKDEPTEKRQEERNPDDKTETVPEKAAGEAGAGSGDESDGGEKGKTEAGKEDPDGERKHSQPDGESPARDAINKRLDELGIKDEPEQPAPKPLVQPQPKPLQPSGKRLTKEQIADHLSSFTEDMFPEGEVVIGNETVDLKDFKENWPDAFNAMKVMANAIANNIVQKSGYVDKNAVIQEFKKRDILISQMSFDREVLRKHKDMDDILVSKEWAEWLPKQSKGVREHLALSLDPEDGIKVLDLFKEDQARAKADEFDKQAREKKNKKDDLHSHTMRQKKTIEKPSGIDENDETAGFNAYSGG